MKNKLRNKKGISIGETLVSVIIMSLLTMAIAVGSGSALKTYAAIKSYSESRVLANTVLQVITEELRYGTDFSGSEIKIEYDSMQYGPGVTLFLDNNDGGELIISRNGESYSPLGSKTYGDYKISELNISIDSDMATVSFNVTLNGNVKASIKDVGVRLLNAR